MIETQTSCCGLPGVVVVGVVVVVLEVVEAENMSKFFMSITLT